MVIFVLIAIKKRKDPFFTSIKQQFITPVFAFLSLFTLENIIVQMIYLYIESKV